MRRRAAEPAFTRAYLPGDDATLADFLEDRSALSPFESVAAAQRSAALARALEHLEPREREIVSRRYGLGTHTPETLEEIGITARRAFRTAGGDELYLVSCLNDSPEWINALAQIARA